MCCGVLQRQDDAVHKRRVVCLQGSALQCVAAYFIVLQLVAVCCEDKIVESKIYELAALRVRVLQCVAVCCSVLHCVVVCCRDKILESKTTSWLA